MTAGAPQCARLGEIGDPLGLADLDGGARWSSVSAGGRLRTAMIARRPRGQTPRWSRRGQAAPARCRSDLGGARDVQVGAQGLFGALLGRFVRRRRDEEPRIQQLAARGHRHSVGASVRTLGGGGGGGGGDRRRAAEPALRLGARSALRSLSAYRTSPR